MKKIVMIVLIGLLLRTYNLGVIPYWHWDEGVNMNLSWNIIHGKPLLFTLKYSFVPHPPLFFIVVGALLKLLGNKLIVLRFFSVILSSLGILVLYLIGRELRGEKLGLFASFLFAVYPDAVYWGRMGFANNLIMLLGLLGLYLFLRGRVYLSCLCAGLASITGIMGVPIILTVFLLLFKQREKLFFGMITAIMPLLLYSIAMLTLVPNEFIYDWIFAFDRLNLGNFHVLSVSLVLLVAVFMKRLIGIIRGVFEIFENDLRFTFGYHLDFMINEGPVIFLLAINMFSAMLFVLTPLSDDVLLNGIGYFWFGTLGLLLVKKREVVLSFFLPMSVFVMFTGRTDHIIIPLHPYFSLGLGVLILWLSTRISLKTSLIIILLGYPFGFALYKDTSAFILGKDLKTENVEEILELTNFVNNNTSPDDLVITDSHIPRFLKPRASILTQSIAVDRRDISYYSGDLKKERFIYNCSYRNAKYLVLDKGISEWLINNSAGDIANDIDSWPIVFETDDFYIRKNPLTR